VRSSSASGGPKVIQRGKVKVQRSIWACDDPRVKLELLSRVYASEFAKTTERKIEREQAPDRKVSIAVVLNTGGKSLEQLAHYL
jgi:hypothetical protein